MGYRYCAAANFEVTVNVVLLITRLQVMWCC